MTFHRYHKYRGNNIIDYELKTYIFIKIDGLWINKEVRINRMNPYYFPLAKCSSCSTRRRTLPTMVLGRVSRNSTCLGIL